MNRARGAASAELAIIVPLIVLLLGGLGAGWRIHAAHAQVAEVASAAARGASLADTGAQAQQWAEQTAVSDLATLGLPCQQLTVSTDASGFAVPLGQPADIEVTVTCELTLSDLGVPVVGGTRWISAQGHEVLDTYRRRAP